MKRIFMQILCAIIAVSSLAVCASATETEQTAALLEGKTISILGDSISTYNGISNGAAAETTNSTIGNGHWYYPGYSVDDPAKTWWGRAADMLGMELLVNNSWSGSYLLKERTYADSAGVQGAWVERCVQLHDDTGDNAGQQPDIIAFYMGTNDFNSDRSNIGTYEAVDFDTLITGGDGAYVYAVPTTSMEAYAICLHKMQNAYPDAEIYCFTVLPHRSGAAQPAAFNADIIKMAEHFGCYTVDLYSDSGITNGVASFEHLIIDYLHPTDLGMNAIAKAFAASVLRNSKYLPEGAVTHSVSYALDDILCKSGTPDTVADGAALTLELTGAVGYLGVNDVTVTMGGVDITDSCYGDGVVSISAVTGDVAITANAVRTVEAHMHDCEHCDGNADWIPWDGSADSLYYGGHFYLTDDVAMDKAFATENLSVKNVDVTICLNGYTLYGSTTSRMFRISHGAKLSIVDCTARTEDGVYIAGSMVPQYHKIRAVAVGVFDTGASEFNLYDGIIDGGGNSNADTVNADNMGGGLIDITGDSAKVNLYGGVLKDYTTYYGGAVYCSAGTVTIDGATITGCNATRGRAVMVRTNGRLVLESGQILGGTQHHGLVALQNNAKFTMNGGKIADAAGNYGYGVHITGTNAVFTMNGGEISGNTHGVLTDNGIFNMTGGEICNNTSANEGAGVRINAGTFKMSGGKIYGNSSTGSASGTGGVRVMGVFEMTGGEVCDNSATVSSSSQIQTSGADAQVSISKDAVVSAGEATKYSVNAYIGSITVSGGNFEGPVANGTNGTLSITGGVFDTNVKNYVAQGYIQLLNGEVALPCENHSYVNGSCSRCGEEDESLVKLLEGKTLSVLGDSISTFGGISDGAAADTTNSTIRDNRLCYPTDFLDDANDTWWMQATKVLGLDLLVNNSWSGSYILKDRLFANGTTAYGAWQDRCVQLHDDTGDNAGETPDIIAFYMGTNDFNFDNARTGTFEEVDFDALITGTDGAYSYATPATTMEAYAICLHKMRQAYPNAEIYCFTVLPREGVISLQPADFNEDVKQIAAHFGAYVVDLYNNSGITADIACFDAMIGDDLHPNPNGMDAITAAFVSAILDNSKYVPENTVIHNVSYALDRVIATNGMPTAVAGDSSLTVNLCGNAYYRTVNAVTVTMGGVDITENSYANGVISIPAVIGDVTITADAVMNVPAHQHDCEHCEADADWLPWDGRVESLYYGGHFYLTEDTTMNKDFYTESLLDPDIDVTICLNGKTLYGSSTARMFRLSDGADVTIVDCTANMENGTYSAGHIVPMYHNIRGVVAGIFGVGESAFTLYDGIIDGGGNNNNSAVNSSNIGGGLIDLNTVGEVNLYGGVLKDYDSYYGGAVFVGSGVLTVDGAIITNCNATRGRAIMVRGTKAQAVLQSGEILGGTHYHGLVTLLSGGRFTMNGGKIANAAGNYGYGVHIGSSTAVFTMNGGEITGNSKQGVWVEFGTFDLKGGKLCQNEYGIVQNGGTINVTGGEITGNTAQENSAILYTAGTLNITGGMFDTDVTAYVAEGYQQYLSGEVGVVCTEHTYENGTCVRCGAEEPAAKFDFAGSTMTLGNELVLNFVYNKALLTGTDNYAKVTIAREDGDYTYEIPQSEWTAFNASLNQIPVKVFAKEMTDEVTVIICNAAGQEVSNPRTGSVVAYCDNLFEKSTVQKDKAMAVDMLNYGAAAQIQFNYREETLANAGLTDELKALATVVTDMQDASVKGPGCAGNTLTLEDKILLNFVYQNTTIDKAAYATVSYVDHYGVAVSYNIEAADFLTFNSSMKMVQINTLVVADCRTMVSVELFDADGNSLGVSKNSVESYTARSGQELFKAILAFGDSAYAKFH